MSLIDPQRRQGGPEYLRPRSGRSFPRWATGTSIARVADRREPEIHSRYAGEAGLADRGTVILYMPVIRDGAVRSVLGRRFRRRWSSGSCRRRPSPASSASWWTSAAAFSPVPPILATIVGQEADAQILRAATNRSSGLFSDRRSRGPAGLHRLPALAADRLAQHRGDRSPADGFAHRGLDLDHRAAGALSLTLAGVLAIFLFYNVVERRVSDERFAASRALSELDARLLATTQEALAEQRKSASEREVLLREIYHRVKNNLQIVQSLLRLGSRDLRPDQREPFESAIRRIGAMARVHSLLYKSPDLASIDFKDYLEDLVRETAEGFGADMRGIRTEIEAESMRVPLDTAVPLAFITVEILTNAFKHAFPDQRRGTIEVTARQDGDHGVLADHRRRRRRDDRNGPAPAARAHPCPEARPSRSAAPSTRRRTGNPTYRVVFPLMPVHQPTLPPPAAASGATAPARS